MFGFACLYAEWAAWRECPAGMRAGFVDRAGDGEADLASEGDAAAAGRGFEQGVVGAEVFGRDAGGVGAVAPEHGPAPTVRATCPTPLTVELGCHVG